MICLKAYLKTPHRHINNIKNLFFFITEGLKYSFKGIVHPEMKMSIMFSIQ